MEVQNMQRNLDTNTAKDILTICSFNETFTQTLFCNVFEECRREKLPVVQSIVYFP